MVFAPTFRLPALALWTAALLAPDAADADTRRDAQLLVGMFGAVCSQAMNDPRAIRRLTKDFDAKRLPRKKVEKTFGAKGQGWSVKAPFGDLSIAMIDPPKCVVVSDSIDADAIQSGFRGYVKGLTDAAGKSLSVTDTNKSDAGQAVQQLSVKIENAPTPYNMVLKQAEGSSWTWLEAEPLNLN